MEIVKAGLLSAEEEDVTISADDTHILVLLLHYIHQQPEKYGFNILIYFESVVDERDCCEH